MAARSSEPSRALEPAHPLDATPPAEDHGQVPGYQGPNAVATSSPLSSPPSSPRVSESTPAMPRGVKKEDTLADAEYLPDAPHMSMGKLPDLSSNGAMSGASTLPPGAENIVIKNHFPVARIKRIMQADDDVGKVAQVTPVVVSKALELFMISLVSRAAAEAKARNSKRVGAVHLKQAITKNEQFDFLNDIVSKVADAPEKSEDPGDAEGKKRKALGRRKKKADDDDDF